MKKLSPEQYKQQIPVMLTPKDMAEIIEYIESNDLKRSTTLAGWLMRGYKLDKAVREHVGVETVSEEDKALDRAVANFLKSQGSK